MKKRVFSILLVIVMTISLLSVTAFAAVTVGNAVITSPTTEMSGPGDIEYTARLNLDAAFQQIIINNATSLAAHQDELSFQYNVKLDPNLKVKENGAGYVYTFTSAFLEVAKVDANAAKNELYVTCKFKDNWNNSGTLASDLNAGMTLVGTAVLDQAGYDAELASADKKLVTGGDIVISTTNPLAASLMGGSTVTITGNDVIIPVTSETTSVVKFDYNKDGAVDATDLKYMLRIYMEEIELQPGSDMEEWALIVFDSNGDGGIDAKDIVAARQVSMEIVDAYMVEMPNRLLHFYQ